jgi:hypothetical protein
MTLGNDQRINEIQRLIFLLKRRKKTNLLFSKQNIHVFGRRFDN